MWRPVLLSAQWVGFFNIESGIGKNTGFRSGRSVEIYDRVFSGISGHMGYHLFFLEVVSQILRFSSFIY